MRCNGLVRLFQLAAVGVAIHNAQAGSAVAIGPHSKLVVYAGLPVGVARQRALAQARRNYGAPVRIIAASDVSGYGAIAVARHPNGYGSVIGVALGKRSATEADALAIEQCLRVGGTNPQVRWSFRG
jgi:hypothetical protein